MAEGEYHVASFVVSSRPEHAAGVADRIASMPGLEIHASQDGKIVVTAEADDVRKLADLVGELEQVEAVIAVAPVYHEYENASGSSASAADDD
jgi:nitrate reductase NapD